MPLDVLARVMAIDVHSDYKRKTIYSILCSVPELVDYWQHATEHVVYSRNSDRSNETAIIIGNHEQLGSVIIRGSVLGTMTSTRPQKSGKIGAIILLKMVVKLMNECNSLDHLY